MTRQEIVSALDNLLHDPGWHLFVQEAKKRWGPEGYARMLKQQVGLAIDRKESAEAAIRAVDFANDEVNAILSWPAQQMAVQQQAIERETREANGEVALSRRGPSL